MRTPYRVRRRTIARSAILALPLLFLLIFFFLPLAAILRHSLRLGDLSARPNVAYLLRVFWFTAWQATASTLLTLALGLPGAHVLSRYRFAGRSWLRALTTVPFVLPTLIVATAFTSLLGPTGVVNAALVRLLDLDSPPLNVQHSVWGILLAHVFYNYSVVALVVGGVWGNLSPRLEEAARSLGANRWRAWCEVTLPQLMPAVAAAALLTFLFCFSSFGVIMVLGGPRFVTVEVEVYRQAVHLLNLPLAAALSVVQLLATFAVMSAYTALQRHAAQPLDLGSRQVVQRRPRTWQAKLWVSANIAIVALLILAPLGALVWRSLTLGGGFGLRHYLAMWRDPGRSIFYTAPPTAIRNSLAFAIAAVALSLVLGTLGAYLLAGREAWMQRIVGWLDPILVLPLGTSAVTLGYGYLLAFGRPPTNWIASPLMVPVVHAMVAFPFVLRSVLPALRAIRPSIREAAASLGVPPSRMWWSIDLPLIARSIAVGAAFAFTISIGEFGATLLIARAEYATIPVVLYRYLSQPGVANVGQALAMSVLLMLTCAISFLIIERFRVGDIGAF